MSCESVFLLNDLGADAAADVFRGRWQHRSANFPGVGGAISGTEKSDGAD